MSLFSPAPALGLKAEKRTWYGPPQSVCANATFNRGCVAVSVLVWCISLHAQVNVLTYQYGESRTGANLNERVLTPSNVNVDHFGKLFQYSVDGAVYAQPLYLAGVKIPNRGIHNVLYVVTEHDSVYAFDADGLAGSADPVLWHASFLDSNAGVTTVSASDVSCDDIQPEIGITGTPVIDPTSGTIYVEAMTKEISQGTTSYVHRLHALDVTTGVERPASPVTIQASYPGTGDGGSTIVFDPKNYKQRPGLLLLDGVLYIAWSSHCDQNTYHGWLMGYDAQSLQQLAVYNSTPNGAEGSFWAGGAAPAADSAGSIYLVSGNGTFDGASGMDLGESYIKLSAHAGLSVADYFAPFNAVALSSANMDLGSAGIALLPDEVGSKGHPHLMVGAGKEGRIYLLDRDNLGGQQPESDSQIVQSIPDALGFLFGNPAYFQNNVYFCPWNGTLKSFPISNGAMATAPSHQTPTVFFYPGCVPSISANGSSDGIAWALEYSGTLHAYDASDLSKELYNSNQNYNRDGLGAYVKFSVPTVANGKVFVGAQNSVAGFGVTVSVTNAASGQQDFAAPGSIIAIYGSGLARETASAASIPLPTTLAGIWVTVNGVPAPLYYASPTQINAQVPLETGPGPVIVAVSDGTGALGSAMTSVQSVAPGEFQTGQRRAAAVNQDGSANGPSSAAAAGSAISAYFTGLGPVGLAVATGEAASSDPTSAAIQPVQASVGGIPAQVLFAGLAPGLVGVFQVNIRVPQIAPGDYPLQISVAGISSNAANISVR